jgi:hypothetical protein
MRIKIGLAALALLPALAAADGCDNAPQEPVTDTLDCEDFDNRDQAQRAYDQAQTTNDLDPHNLDEDGDGQACEGELPDPERGSQS